MSRLSFRALVITGAAALTLPATAMAADIGIGITGGTTGVSAEVKVAPSQRIMLRGGYNFAEFSGDIDSDGINYDGDFTLSNFGAFADFAPFGNSFVVSGGAYIGDKEAELTATPSTNVNIGGMSFTPAEVGSLFGTVQFKEVAPYAGIGFDSFARTSGNWSFNAHAGVMFVGSADVELTSANGLLSSDPTLLNEIREEVLAIEQDAEDYKYFPVLTVGVTRKF